MTTVLGGTSTKSSTSMSNSGHSEAIASCWRSTPFPAPERPGGPGRERRGGHRDYVLAAELPHRLPEAVAVTPDVVPARLEDASHGLDVAAGVGDQRSLACLRLARREHITPSLEGVS